MPHRRRRRRRHGSYFPPDTAPASRAPHIKVLGTALGVGILVDATVVRALLVPALVSLLGRWNWWLPGWLARLLRVAPSPLPAPEVVTVPAPRQEAASTTVVR